MTVISWAMLVMGVDVSHVYSTIYRTYLDRETRQQHGLFLYLLPFGVLIVCLLVYSVGALFFWRVMAYLAVFHFARQQYGFMRVYSRHEKNSTWHRRIDALAIYTATLYPILDWHLAGPKHFNWFMKGDFLYLSAEGFRAIARVAYMGVIGLYAVKECLQIWKSITMQKELSRPPAFNLPRNAIITGTFLSWYVGIVHFNSDLAFTAINVMSHGIPYMALVWIWGRKKYASPTQLLGQIFRPRYVAFFVVLLLGLAYMEEGFWNVWVWHEPEHAAFFRPFHDILGDLDAGSPWLKLLVPLLSVPQITHYVIDGFIWKIRSDRYGWRDLTLEKTAKQMP